MFSATLIVKNKTGLHARPASQLVEISQKFDSELRIKTENTDVDPKSIISILSAGIKQGTVIELTAEGSDEDFAGAELVALIESFTD